MTGRRRFSPAVAVLAIAVAAGCGAPAADSPTVAATATAGAPSARPSASTTSAEPRAQIIALSFAGGRAGDGPGRIAIPVGETVELVVTSDVADEIHLHGYDRSVTVEAGGTATLSFTADIPGVFEVELEELGAPLARLEVS